MLKSTVNEHRYLSLEFTLYISYNHIVQIFYFEVISKRVLIIFAPEQRFLFILARFSVRFPLFSYDLKTIFAIYCILMKVTNTYTFTFLIL
jgi:hypothetical protein